MVDKNHRPDNQRYTRWSIRRLSVGVASVVVASGFFILISNPVNAQVGSQNKVVTTTPSNSSTDFGKSILDSKVGQTESPSAEKKETPNTTKTSQDLSGKTIQTPDKKVQEKQEITKENKVGKSTAEAAKKIQKATETVIKEATPKAQEDPTLAQAKQSVADNIKGSTDVPASFLQNATHPGPFTAGVNEVIPYELFGGDGMLTRLLLKSSNGAPWSDNGTAKHAGLLPFANIPKGKYFYQVSLNGKAAGKQGKALLDQLKANGTQSYTATVTVYGSKDGKVDLSNVIATRQVTINLNSLKSKADPSLEQAKKSISENIKESTDVPASFLQNANHPGPFTAGVNEVIPYELFGGDGMLTRLLLKSSNGAPWSDNGTANHAGLPPFAGIPKGKYFYQVSLDGNAAGKQGRALLDQLKANGTHTYTATVKVYGATKDGKADLNNVIATRQVKLNLNGTTTADQIKKSVLENIKESTDVPASFLQNANHPGPFTAGVNEVIPYELFGGDGMLTRLLLKSSNGAPWSDNGTANHPGLLPLAGLGKGKYFYQVSLNGNAAGKQGKALLDQLKANGTHSYTATVTVYGATKDGKADLNNVIATRQVKLNLNGTTTAEQIKKSVSENIKDKIDVPASYLKNAVFPGPFTAGVNQVIPYELFGGDGMLTRLLLKSSNGAPWSDNGSAKHPGLLPLAGLGKGQYFYQVSLDGNAAGKQDKALLEQLKANGTHLYKATVTVYGATKDGKADLKNVIATKSVTINLKGEKKADSKGQSQQGQNDQVQNQGKKADHDGSKHSNKGGTPSATTSKGGQATASKKSLPNTGQKSSLGLTVLGLLGLSAAAILALVGMKRREKK
ncbi:cell wall surface anchor family protein [Streptococcus anginosus]|uniref:Fibronectin-binding SSURE repeat-containing protein n=3 Tax=Streptococcus TaxID=1301 RepID=A0AAP6BPT4_STRAP|nr:fibronectin-binding SSURE repeat-containing protein [Streptococcus anginosus]ALL03882.1 Cell wall surface anchor family protein [Streptococcus anginosus]MCW1035103.1 fibronectin-binding SSURE repeat-containing protein [Streptococcus anginosus]MDU6600197.1 fibronectin-binding SSURE repeat-containing protein [Streptococcus anginosus]MDX5040753.1 fibronectin-binding SSURE repeat-containing protein [Streptococcus anginosus]PRT74878.1 YSIRK signal domain/LPXTG anchor domain surface protein [Stre